MDIYFTALAIHLFFCLIPAVTGAFRYRHLDKNIKIFVWYLCLVFLVESYNLYKTYLGENNIWIYHFYGPIEYAFLITILSSWLEEVKFRLILKLSIIGFIVMGIINGIVEGDLSKYNYLPTSIAYPIFASISAYILIKMLKGDWGNIRRKPAFWICSALLLISSCNIVYFSFQKFINENMLVWPWVLHLVVNMIAYLFYAYGLVVKPKQEYSDHNNPVIASRPKSTLDIDDIDF